MGNHDSGASNYKRVITKIADSYYTCKKCGNIIEPDLMDYYNCGFDAAYCSNCKSTEDIVYYDDKYNDNHLFDEVYEGALTISPKIILSHEPITIPFMFNIHGHDHARWFPQDNLHYNMCAELIDYTPISLNSLIKGGYFKDIKSIHRITIDKAVNSHSKSV